MADLTLKQAKDYVRSKVKELKNDAIVDNMLTIDFGLAQVKVQDDLSELGIKEWLRTAYLTGPTTILPSDLMPVPNAVRDVRASNGEHAYISTNLSGSNNDLTFTAVEPGTVGNGIKVSYVNNTANPIAVTEVDMTAKEITIGFDASLPIEELTALMVMNAINSHLVAASLITATLKTSNDGTGTIAVASVTLANGTGTGWKPGDERTIKDSNRMEESYIEAASINFPKYVIKGDVNKRKILELYPKSIKHIELTYYYTIPEMTNDGEVLSIPLQYRELVLIEVIRKAYESLDMMDKVNTRNAEYQLKIGKVYDNYQKGLKSSITEKQRLQVED